MKNHITIWAGQHYSSLYVDGHFVDGVKSINFHHEAGEEPELSLTIDVGRFFSQMEKEKAESSADTENSTSQDESVKRFWSKVINQ